MDKLITEARAPTEDIDLKVSQKRFWRKKYQRQVFERYNNNSYEDNDTNVSYDIIHFIKEAIVRRKSVIAFIAFALLFLLISTSSVVMTFLSILGGGDSIVKSSTFLSSDDDILITDEHYEDLEEELEKSLEEIEDKYPDYDEYEYFLDEIGHNPFELISYLTAKYGNFKEADVLDELKVILEKQYELILEEREEVREKLVRNEETGEEETVEYTVKILTITLLNKGIDFVAQQMLEGKQLSSYAIYKACYGNRPYLFDESSLTYTQQGGGGNDPSNLGSVDISGLTDEGIKALLQEADKYVGTPYVWGGSTPKGFDCSGFVCYVINHSIGSVGRVNARTLYSMTKPISNEEAKPGDLIFFKGTQKGVPGLSHIGIYVGNGKMIHAGSPVKYADITTKYWQDHLLGFTRIE